MAQYVKISSDHSVVLEISEEEVGVYLYPEQFGNVSWEMATLDEYTLRNQAASLVTEKHINACLSLMGEPRRLSAEELAELRAKRVEAAPAEVVEEVVEVAEEIINEEAPVEEVIE